MYIDMFLHIIYVYIYRLTSGEWYGPFVKPFETAPGIKGYTDTITFN